MPLFQAFKTGPENDAAGWDDTPSYVPGRFHAHALPSGSATPSGLLSSRSSLQDGRPGSPNHLGGISTHFSPFSPAPAGLGRPQYRKGISRRARLLEAETDQPGLGGVNGRGLGEELEDERSWLLLRPGRKRVEGWLETWWRRWAVLVGVPCLFVWLWCSIPFPVSDPYVEEPPWHLPWPGEPPSNASASASASALGARRDGGVGVWVARNVVGLFGGKVEESGDGTEGLNRRRRSRRSNAELQQQDGNGVVWLHFLPNPSSTLLSTSEPSLAPSISPTELSPSQHTSKHLPSSPKNGRDDDGTIELPPTTPSPPGEHDHDEDLPVDANFYFFLFVYYGVYLAVALVFITKLFDLYRLNWWPTSLGGTISYTLFWSLSLLVGFLLHFFDLDGLGRRSRHPSHPSQGAETFDWERKTTWVLLAFSAMTLPALACFIKLRADRRQSYRRSLTAAQKTFLERQLAQRMPRSYKRFLWFLLTLTLSLLALIIGQGFATVYLSTLPHNNVDGLVYVWSWIATCNVLNSASNWVLQRKVRSRALVFVFRFYYFLVYHIFYRNLFARLRSPDQAIFIQLLSSSFVIFWYPLSMSKTFHRFLKWSVGFDKEWEEYAEGVGTMLYLRNLSENVTMVAFLGWLTILHFGSNSSIYPFFAFDSDSGDPYTYRLTAAASLVIWATELGSSFVARMVIWWGYKMDVTNLGLDEFREHPELVVACIWASIHVLMDILLFLIKLNFR